MQQGQKGSTRDGQHGTLAHVYNGTFAIFQSDTGARFTIIAAEFTPDNASRREADKIFKVHSELFGHIQPGEGFDYGVNRVNGHVAEVWCVRIAPCYSPAEQKHRLVTQHILDHSRDTPGLWQQAYHGLTGEAWPASIE